MSLLACTFAVTLAAVSAPQDEDGVLFGRAVCAVPDQDGDGKLDFVTTAPEADGEPSGAGRVYLFAGDPPKLLRAFPGAFEMAAVGARVEWIQDAGKAGALLLSSVRAPLWRIEEMDRCGTVSHVGSSLCFLDDRDGDGVPEVLIGGADAGYPHGRRHRSGSLRIVSGATGEELWFLAVDQLPEATRAR